jgi:hypothetical protein
MPSWADFAAAAPGLAVAGLDLFGRRAGEALLATVRGADDPPRLHPVTVALIDGRLFVFVIGRSPKAADLAADGRFALHAHVDPDRPVEFSLRGRAVRVDDPSRRATVAAGWAFAVDETYDLFELSVERALLGARETADDWPPQYTAWSAAPASPGS